MSLYLNLMKKILVNSIYEDNRLVPNLESGILQTTATTSNSNLRATGDEWPSKAHTMIGMKRLDNLQYCMEEVDKDIIPGNFIETGVFRGGACIFMAAYLKESDFNRKVYVCDSFFGFPQDRKEDQGDVCLKLNNYFAVSEEDVKENFKKYDLLGDNVVFVKGYFSETLPTIQETFSIIRLDGDMYSSTMDALVNLYPRLSVGGFCIIDDYHSHIRCQQAVNEYREAHGIQEPIHQIDNQGAFWRRQ